MTHKLLLEAVAEAKQVVDIASANARAQLAEEFSPKYSSIITKNLREANIEDTSGIGGNGLAVDNPGPKEPSKASWDSSDIENPGQEIEPMGKGDATKEPVKEASDPFPKDEEDEAGEEDEVNEDHMGTMNTAGEEDVDVHSHDGGEDTNVDVTSVDDKNAHDDELDLEAIIAELEHDGQVDGGGSEPDPYEKFNSFDDDKKVDEDWDDPMAGATAKGPLKPIMGARSKNEGKDVNGFESSEDGVPGGKKVKANQEISATEEERNGGSKVSESVSEELDEILREMDADTTTESEKIATENAELKRDIREHQQVVKFLKSKLSEANMLNSKLMYTTKLFREFVLDNKSKEKIIESFDRASTIRETKNLYATLHEVFTAKGINKEKKKLSNGAKSITEGLASAALGSAKPKHVLVETVDDDNSTRSRLLRNAGIVKS